MLQRERVRYQTMVLFPTLPNYFLCTTLGNTNPGNCIFSLKYCMLLYNQTQNTFKLSLSYRLIALHYQWDMVVTQ